MRCNILVYTLTCLNVDIAKGCSIVDALIDIMNSDEYKCIESDYEMPQDLVDSRNGNVISGRERDFRNYLNTRKYNFTSIYLY